MNENMINTFREGDLGSFSLVFLPFGGVGHVASVFYKRLATLVSQKRSSCLQHSDVMAMLYVLQLCT